MQKNWYSSIKRIGFTLIRVHRQQNITTSMPDNEILLQNLKWPIESMFVGLRPQTQKTDLANWDKYTQCTPQTLVLPNLVTQNSTFTGTTSGSTVTVTPTWATSTVTITNNIKTIDRLTISAHGIFLYNDMPSEFFHQYTSYTYGGPNIRTPEDEGCLLIPFNLYPGTYQPSGHVNVSRAREFYIRYVSSVIGQTTAAVGNALGTVIAGELVIVASAINFLLISDGSAVLRYST